MIRISNIPVPLDYTDASIMRLAENLLKARGRVRAVRIARRSVDARDKGNVHFVLSIDVTIDGDEAHACAACGRGVQATVLKPPAAFTFHREAAFQDRPVVVGLGPAGLAAGWLLAKSGARPIVLERGCDVDRRAQAVTTFWRGGALDPNTNVQFGEGGAGTFSDGKLTTGISDPRCAAVLNLFYECGAPEEILYQAKPHIGTDNLPRVVKNIRQSIVQLGGEVRFQTRLTGLMADKGRVTAAVAEDVNGLTTVIPTDTVILAIGHSARDTFEMLHGIGVEMTVKPFSIGARIEHRQKMIDVSQYGRFADHPALGAADYKLSTHLSNGRGAYTFCMCPGGTVVASASEPGGIVTNGMSPFARDGVNSNSALLIGVGPEDFPGDDPLAGVRFQRQWERAAFELGGGDYRAPAQRVGSFLRGDRALTEGDVEPTYRPGVTYADLRACLPEFVSESIRQAITRFDRMLRGFASPGAVLTGVETRSSSPIRITRGEDLQSSLRGLYPCGEGAGYAGGIMSAAVDGLRCAEQALSAHTLSEH